MDIDEVCSKTVEFERLLWIASKKGWEDASPRYESVFAEENGPLPNGGFGFFENDTDDGYWKRRFERGEFFLGEEPGDRSTATRVWLVDQARIRHIKKNYYTFDDYVLKKATARILLWIVLFVPVTVAITEGMITILGTGGDDLAFSWLIFGIVPWSIVLIALFLKEDSDFELEELQSIMLEYLDEIGMRPEGARKLTPEEVRRMRKERQKAAYDLYKWKIKLSRYLFGGIDLKEYSVEQRSFIQDRINKEIHEIEDVNELDEQGISERVERYSQVFHSDW